MSYGESQNVASSNGNPKNPRDPQPSDTVADVEKNDVAINEPANHENSSEDSEKESSKPDNRPRHARTGEPLLLIREIAVVTVICLAQLMTQAGVGQGNRTLALPP